MYTLWYYFTLFAIYSIAGWAGDTLYTRLYEGRWAKRGFHHGPFFMLYGWGALIGVLLFNERSSVLVMVPVMALCSCIVEYTGSWVMERVGLTGWDYRKNFLNLHGRICLQSISIFTIGAVLVILFVQPVIRHYLEAQPAFVIQVAGMASFAYLFVWGAVRMYIQYRYYQQYKQLRTQAYDISE